MLGPQNLQDSLWLVSTFFVSSLSHSSLSLISFSFPLFQSFFLPSPGDLRLASTPSFCSAGDRTWGFVRAKQAFHNGATQPTKALFSFSFCFLCPPLSHLRQYYPPLFVFILLSIISLKLLFPSIFAHVVLA